MFLTLLGELEVKEHATLAPNTHLPHRQVTAGAVC